MDVECCICLEALGGERGRTEARFVSCKHGVCQACFGKMLAYDLRCPLCKKVVLGVRSDGGERGEGKPSSQKGEETVLIELTRRWGKVGITLESGRRAGEVSVASARRKSAFRTGDVILSINDMPMSNALCARQLFDTWTAIRVHVVRRGGGWRRMCLLRCCLGKEGEENDVWGNAFNDDAGATDRV